MKLRCLVPTALVSAFCLSGPAMAVEPIQFEIRNNADLLAVCAAKPSDQNYVQAIHFCHGFGVGFTRYNAMLNEGNGYRPLFCFPPALTRTQTLDAYVAYSRAHPEYNKEAVGDVLLKFLIETYPCPDQKQ
jgi:hypothetical protein